MNNIPRDLSLIIFQQFDSECVPPAAQVCRKWYEEIKRICSVFCETHQLDVTTPVKTFCNYRTWTSKPSLLSSTTYNETLLKIFGLGLGDLYNWILDENLDSEKLKKFLKENEYEKRDVPLHIYHNRHVAFPVAQEVRILDLDNHEVETLEINSYPFKFIYCFDENEILFRSSDGTIVQFDRATKQSVEFKMPFMCQTIIQTKNFLICPVRICDKQKLYSLNKDTHNIGEFDCPLALFAASNKKDLFATFTQDSFIKIYKDEGKELKILHNLFFSGLEATVDEPFYLKFYRDLLFVNQAEKLFIINPRTGALVSQLNDIKGNGSFSLSNNQLIKSQIGESHEITYLKYSFSG